MNNLNAPPVTLNFRIDPSPQQAADWAAQNSTESQYIVNDRGETIPAKSIDGTAAWNPSDGGKETVVTGPSYSIERTDGLVSFAGSCTLTLPDAQSYPLYDDSGGGSRWPLYTSGPLERRFTLIQCSVPSQTITLASINSQTITMLDPAAVVAATVNADRTVVTLQSPLRMLLFGDGANWQVQST